MSRYISRYRALPTNQKVLLAIANQQCGFGIAAELCNHLINLQHDCVDDGFWDNLEPHERGQLISLAKAQGHHKVGALDLMVCA